MSADRTAEIRARLGLVPDFDRGLVPVVVQEVDSNEVLMLAYMNREAFDKTKRTGYAHYFSRSRNKLWKKGESSGHLQHVRELFIDCDNDTLLLKIVQEGGTACHTGHKTCFFRKVPLGATAQ